MSKIDFIGIGAQKSGTSWLFKQFEKSSQIEMPPIKELHYFDRSKDYDSPDILTQQKISKRIINPKWVLRSIYNTIINIKQFKWYYRWYTPNYNDEWYLSLFNDFTKCKGEITPAYAILNDSDVAKMSELLGKNTKIIFLVRNPIERSWSSYKYEYNIKDIEQFDINHFKQYLISDGHLKRSDYLKTIRVYKKYFNNIFIGFFDAIIENPMVLLRDIFNYLELDVNELINYSELNKKINSSQEITIPDNIKELLFNIHSKNMLTLDHEFGDYFSKWNNQYTARQDSISTNKSSIII